MHYTDLAKHKIPYYLAVFSIIMFTAFIGNKFRRFVNMDGKNDEHDMIRMYLLNDSPLYGNNKPKIWIHTKFEYNSRKWQSFQSRSSLDLNQPYIHLTIKSIIDHCSEDFHICLIDDDTFSKLLPSWDIKLSSIAEPMKTKIREIGLAELVYQYGGMVVPNSLVCLRNLKKIYESATEDNKMFVVENINRNVPREKIHRRYTFMPNTYIMGAKRDCPILKEYIDYLKDQSSVSYFSAHPDFEGENNEWCLQKIQEDKVTLVGGEYFGVKSGEGKPILVDDLMGEDYLDISEKAVGIYIPESDILTRTKYQWFAIIPSDQLFEVNAIVVKYLKASIIDSTREYYMKQKRAATVSSI